MTCGLRVVFFLLLKLYQACHKSGWWFVSVSAVLSRVFLNVIYTTSKQLAHSLEDEGGGGSFTSTPLRKTQHTRKHAYTQIHKNYIFILIQTCTKESKHKTNRYTSNHYSIRAHTTVAMWLTAALILTLLAGSSIANLPLEMLTSMASFSMHEGEKKIIYNHRFHTHSCMQIYICTYVT